MIRLSRSLVVFMAAVNSRSNAESNSGLMFTLFDRPQLIARKRAISLVLSCSGSMRYFEGEEDLPHETRPPVALGSSPELSAFTMSLATPVVPFLIFFHVSLSTRKMADYCRRALRRAHITLLIALLNVRSFLHRKSLGSVRLLLVLKLTTV